MTILSFKNFYRLIQGDNLKVLPMLKDESIDCVITDPPFLALFGTSKDKYDLGNYSIIEGWFRIVSKESFRILKKGGKLLVFCDWRSYPAFWRSILHYPFEQRNLVVWITDAGRKYNIFRFCHQFVAIFTKPPFQIKCPPGRTFDYFRCYNVATKDRLHPTQKPEGIIRYLLRNSSEAGDIVLDPFIGSGTTMLACQNLKRSCIGIELNPEYCEIVKKRCFGRKFLDREVKYKFEVFK